MNLKILFTAALLASSAVVVSGCAHNGHEQTGGAVLSDVGITTKVKSALLVEKEVNSFDIQVETFNGVVQLSGFVDSQWQIDKAAQIASNVEGVIRVKNDLIHKSK